MFNAAHCNISLLSAAFIFLPRESKEQYEAKSLIVQNEESALGGNFTTLKRYIRWYFCHFHFATVSIAEEDSHIAIISFKY